MKKDVLIHPSELSRRWIDRAADLGIDTLGIHPVGGYAAPETLRRLTETVKEPGFRALIDYAKERGLGIEYEMHAAGYLLDRALFGEHPEYFRTDENGVRTPDHNLCVSDEDGMETAAERAAELAMSLYGSSHDFYFWMDDIRGKRCMCQKCRELTASEQQLMFVNRMISEIRKHIPDANMAYLAYFDSMELPLKVKPAPGVFLEYAPFEKYRGASDFDLSRVKREAEMLHPLTEFFGHKNSKVLEYWLDNSLFSNWTKPPKKFSCNRDDILKDMKIYKAEGFETLSSFACYLGEDYEALYGEPDIGPFCDAAAML